MSNGQESDKQEYQKSEETIHYLFNQLRVVAKKRILECIIPLSDSLYILKRKGSSSVLLSKAAKLLCNINFMNCNYREKYAAEFDTTTYREIMDECEKRRTLLSSSITAKIDNLFDDLLEYRFDKNANRIIGYHNTLTTKNLLNQIKHLIVTNCSTL